MAFQTGRLYLGHFNPTFDYSVFIGKGYVAALLASKDQARSFTKTRLLSLPVDLTKFREQLQQNHIGELDLEPDILGERGC